MWGALAWFVSRPRVADWLVRRAFRTPYADITSPDGQSVYMKRWWLFNPYPGSDQCDLRKYPWLPVSIRVHHILREDADRHLHDHPWDARTIILIGGYVEVREDGRHHYRVPGDTATIKHDEFHRIVYVDARRGAVTLFITFKYRGTWGFKVDGAKVPWRTYLGLGPK